MKRREFFAALAAAPVAAKLAFTEPPHVLGIRRSGTMSFPINFPMRIEYPDGATYEFRGFVSNIRVEVV